MSWRARGQEACPLPGQEHVRNLFALGCMQAPVAMEQVLLAWEGGESVLLARIKDAQGSWLCFEEVRSKLVSSVSDWARHIGDGERSRRGFVLHAVCTWLDWAPDGMVWLLWVQLGIAAGQPRSRSCASSHLLAPSRVVHPRNGSSLWIWPSVPAADPVWLLLCWQP